MTTEATLDQLTAHHHRLAVAWWESRSTDTPHWFADPGQWSMLRASWQSYYVQLRANSAIGYAEQMAALTWAYQSDERWGNNMTWAAMLSHRTGGQKFAQHCAKLLDKVSHNSLKASEPEHRDFHTASPEFTDALTSNKPEDDPHVIAAEASLDVARARVAGWARQDVNSEYILRGAQELEAAILEVMTATAAAVASGRKSTAGNIAVKGSREQIAKTAARAIVRLIYMGEQ